MLTRFGLAPRLKGMSAADFQAHWKSGHARLVAAMPELTRYWQHHAILHDGEPLLPWAGFDACAQFGANSLSDYDRGFSSAHYLGAVRADEPNFVDNARGGSMLCEHLFSEGTLSADNPLQDQLTGVRLMSFMRLAPMVPLARLGDALAHLPRAREGLGREVFLAATLGQRASVFDALEVIAFPSPGAAMKHVQGGEARRRSEDIAGMVRGTERIVSEVVVVI